MRYFIAILTIFCVLPFSAQAQTSISKEQTNQYYAACAAQTDPRFSKDTQKLFCACTAARYQQALTVEDVQIMGGQTQAARDAMNKMIVNVYAPCMQYPTRDYHYQTCISNPKVKILGNPQKVCECSANEVAQYIGENGQALFAEILKTSPNITDPMQAIYNSEKFQSYAQSKLLGCIR